MPLIALFVGFIIAYLSTLVHLHPVIGAYAAGLMFASTEERHEILQYLHPIYSFFVPLFFVSMGMQVDVFVLKDVAVFGIVLIVVAIIAKVFGCAIFARVSGFNWLGSIRIGAGMAPRGEVGLITAGAALLEGAISLPMYAAAVAVSMVSTLITPPMLKPLFGKGGSGLTSEEESET
jgi:Kef-type K+ transport system membrane component KefB